MAAPVTTLGEVGLRQCSIQLSRFDVIRLRSQFRRLVVAKCRLPEPRAKLPGLTVRGDATVACRSVSTRLACLANEIRDGCSARSIEVRTRKGTEMEPGGSIVGERCLNGVGTPPEAHVAPVDIQLCKPEVGCLVKSDSFVLPGAISMGTSVPSILGTSREPKIGAAIIESIAIDVVNLNPPGSVQKMPVHQDDTPTYTRDCVASVCRAPTESTKFWQVILIDNRNAPASKHNRRHSRNYNAVREIGGRR